MLPVFVSLCLMLIVQSIITWGLAVLITQESGPFAIFDRLRVFALQRSMGEIIPKLSRYRRKQTMEDSAQEISNVVQDEMEVQGSILSQHDFIKSLSFIKTFWGNVYSILDCYVCCSIYVGLGVSLFLSSAVAFFVLSATSNTTYAFLIAVFCFTLNILFTPAGIRIVNRVVEGGEFQGRNGE